MIAESFASPIWSRVNRDRLAVYTPNMMTALVLSFIDIFATEFPQLLVVALFLTTGIDMGLCQGITSVGTAGFTAFPFLLTNAFG